MTRLVTLSLLMILGLNLSAQIYGEEILHWEFENGIPETWTNESLSGIGLWEYRGPATEPDNTVCSQGSCGIGSVPPPSLSAENGFVIFDSNYWDDDIGPCGQIGTGQDPGPHEAWLITESVDLSSETDIVLTFQQQYKHYISADYDIYTQVEISTDGGENWTSILQNPGNYAVSENVEWASVNITEFAAGQSDVKFKFLFTGFYYWWCLDDIVLYIPNQNDLLLNEVKYTNFNFAMEPQGFGDMEYNHYPETLIPQFHFSGNATNIGGLAQQNTKLLVAVSDADSGTEIYSGESSGSTLSPGITADFSLGITYTPLNEVGHYYIDYEIVQDQADEDPTNNFAQKDYYIHEHLMGVDENELQSIFEANPNFEGETFEVGNLFHCWESGLQITSLSVALGDSTTVGTEIYGIVYDLNRDTIFGQSAPYTVNAWDLNGPGENKFVCLPLEQPIFTNDTMLYLAMAGHDGLDGEQMSIGRSGVPPASASLVYYPESNGLYFLLQTPMVRMNVFAPGLNPGCTDSEAMNFDPTADTDDGCCRYPGCTIPQANNYDPDANWDDGSCIVPGCTDPEADNYDPIATLEDGSCEYFGCTDPQANNYDSTANVDDGSCIYNDAAMTVSAMEGCAPFTITVTNQTDVLDEATCSFDMGDGFIYDQCDETFDYTFDDPGEYSITYTYTVGEFVSEVTIGPIVVGDSPDAPVLSYDEENVELSCDCDESMDINWYLDGELVNTGGTTYTPVASGDYTVEVVNDDGCAAISDAVNVVIISVEDLAAEQTFRLYPNPTQNQITVIAPCLQGQLQIRSLDGQLVMEKTLYGSEQVVLDQNMAPGMYLVQLSCSQNRWTERLVIKP